MLERLSCLQCGKLLNEADVENGVILKRCPRCKALNKWEFIEVLRTFAGGISKLRSKRAMIVPEALPNKQD